jgi:hypothetical protein
MKDILHYSMLQAYPMFWIQNLKDQGVDAGWDDTTAWVHMDFNAVKLNEISGASLTTRNSSDVEVVLTDTETYGRSDAIINNTANGTHLDKCFFTLPAGTYIINTWFSGNSSAGDTSIYNKTDDIRYILRNQSHYTDPLPVKLTISNPKEFTMDFLGYVNNTEAPANLGTGYTGSVLKSRLYNSVQVIKIG